MQKIPCKTYPCISLWRNLVWKERIRSQGDCGIARIIKWNLDGLHKYFQLWNDAPFLQSEEQEIWYNHTIKRIEKHIGELEYYLETGELFPT